MRTQKVFLVVEDDKHWEYLVKVYKELHGTKNIIDIDRELGYIELKSTEEGV